MSANRWNARDKATVIRAMAEGLTSDKAGAMVGRSGCAVRKMRARTDPAPILRDRTSKSDPLPDDFKEQWAAKSMEGLAEHYSRSKRKIADWVRIAGLKRSASWRSEAGLARLLVSQAPRIRHKPHRKTNAFLTAAIDRPRVDASLAGRAAEYLRRYGPVIRCRSDGRYHEGGTHWRRGNTLMTGAQIIDRAKQKGWDAGAWERLG